MIINRVGSMIWLQTLTLSMDLLMYYRLRLIEESIAGEAPAVGMLGIDW